MERQDRTIFSLLVSFLLIASLAFITTRSLGHTEKSEWLIYEIGSVVIFVLIAVLGRFKKLSNNHHLNRVIKLSPVLGLIAFATYLIFSSFFFRIINYGYLVLVFMGMAPGLYLYRNDSDNFVRSLLVNMVLIFCVAAYFIEYLGRFGLRQYLLILITWIVLSLFLIAFGTSKTKISKAYNKIISVAVFLTVIFVAFTSTRKPIEYFHYSFYLGPAYELNQGKSLLSDIPSQYGYLSIKFIKLILNPLGINYENFHLLNTSLFFLYFVGFYFAYKKIFHDNLFTGLFSLVTIFFKTRFYLQELRGLPPSIGPMRFGFGLLVVLILLYFPQKIKFWAASLLVAVAIFWSVETAIYVFPAFLFTLLIKAIVQGKKFIKILIVLLNSLIPFAVFTAGIFFWIILGEYRYHQALPVFFNYFQFVLLSVEGYGAELIPLFGSYYLAVLLIIVGLCLVFFQKWSMEKNRLLIPLCFLAVHNVAIFSYFISRSIDQNIVTISLFILLELAIIYQGFKESKLFWSRVFLPSTLFLTLFMTICGWNFLNFFPPNNLKDFEINEKTESVLADYQTIKKTYGLTPENVLVISKDYDTLLITANQIKTILPLNPCLLTILVPYSPQKYFYPNLNKIKNGTKLVYTNDIPDLFNFFNRAFILEETKPGKKIGSLSVYNIVRLR